jgi:hypothetical protein
MVSSPAPVPSSSRQHKILDRVLTLWQDVCLNIAKAKIAGNNLRVWSVSGACRISWNHLIHTSYSRYLTVVSTMNLSAAAFCYELELERVLERSEIRHHSVDKAGQWTYEIRRDWELAGDHGAILTQYYSKYSQSHWCVDNHRRRRPAANSSGSRMRSPK